MSIRAVATVSGLVLALSVGCSGIVANVNPEAYALAPNVTLVVGLPPQLDFRQSGEQGRVTRRFGDILLAATGGRAFVPEELDGAEGAAAVAALRAAGAGDLTHTITFRIVATRVPRAETSPSPLRGVRSAMYMVWDYEVRLEVARPGTAQVLGTVQTLAAASLDDPEIAPDGESLGLQSAVDEAVIDAVARFAPALRPAEPPPRLMEMPAGPPGRKLSTGDRLNTLAMLYPEHSAEVLHSLAASEAQFLVLSPGTLQRAGVAAGDLLGVSRGAPLGSRAALARKLAAGVVPAMYAERGGERFLISESRLTPAPPAP